MTDRAELIRRLEEAFEIPGYGTLIRKDVFALVGHVRAAEAEAAELREAVAREREACAEVAENMPLFIPMAEGMSRASSPRDAATAIRARGAAQNEGAE